MLYRSDIVVAVVWSGLMVALSLAEPNEIAKQHSAALVAYIIDQIDKKGPMPFYDYMHAVLYHAQFGYYRCARQPFGREGDFITSSDCGPWFARALANQFLQIPINHAQSDICELGAGSGQMALDLLLALQKHQVLPKYYYILEPSASLVAAQRATLAQQPALLEKIIWVQDVPDNFHGMLFANEVLDAMPVHRFKKSSLGYLQYFVDYVDGKLTGDWKKAQNEVPNAIIQQNLKVGHCFEHNPHYASWLSYLYRRMRCGICLLIDYGYVASNYYAKSLAGYLRAFYCHKVHDDVFFYPGLQDITTHVDFSLLADAALESGWDLSGFTNQANFLLGCGLANFTLPDVTTSQGIQARSQIKKLMLPQEMGELFKVMALAKHIDGSLIGFEQDQRHRL